MHCIHVDNNRNLDIDADGEALILREQGHKTGSLPLGSVERIFLHGETRIQARALAKIGAAGIGLIVMRGIQHEPTLFLPRAHHDATSRLRQCHAHLAHRLQEARLLLANKWQSQVTVLERALKHHPAQRLAIHGALHKLQSHRTSLDAQGSLNALLGWEGACAEIYYRALAAQLPAWTGFVKRNRRPPKDPANALMSLCYTLAHAEAVLSAHRHGLDPDIGMLHAIEFGRESLACDLMEPLRALIDEWLVNTLQDGQFSAADFTQEGQACLLGKAARSRLYTQWESQRPHWRSLLDSHCAEAVARWKAYPCAT